MLCSLSWQASVEKSTSLAPCIYIGNGNLSTNLSHRIYTHRPVPLQSRRDPLRTRPLFRNPLLPLQSRRRRPARALFFRLQPKMLSVQPVDKGAREKRGKNALLSLWRWYRGCCSRWCLWLPFILRKLMVPLSWLVPMRLRICCRRRRQLQFLFSYPSLCPSVAIHIRLSFLPFPLHRRRR